MNSSNLQPRQFVHNTCELSIDDKKSPFPAWMKFNKPNPLRFSLTVSDPDRPELEPMRVEGDRSKLESLHHTIEDYVKDLVSRAPLPQINGEGIGQVPRSTVSNDTIDSSESQHRPIDALKVSDEKPRIEADGLSRHLFYLGSGADANTTTMSLSTLQLFDLSSALSEGVNPVTEPEVELEKSVTAAETLVSPIILPPEAVTSNNQSSATTSLKSDQSDVEQPRVVLPSANASEDLYGLETESSILERSNSTKDRFKMPKPSLGSLNLPELPDFSRSPLTSIPLWLGLGSMAAVILTSPLWMSMFKGGDSIAKKPTTPTTQVATAPTDIPAPYQPSDPTVASGVGIPSPNFPNSGITTNPGGLGASPNPPGVTSIVGQNPGIVRTNVSPANSTTGVNSNFRNPLNNGTSRPAGLNNQTNQPSGNNAAAIARARALQDRIAPVNTRKPDKAPDGTNQSSSSGVTDQNSRGSFASSEDPRLTEILGGETAPRISRSRRDATENPDLIKTPPPIRQDNSFGGSGSLNIPPSAPQTLEAPIAPADSLQAKGLQEYFQKIWRADPNFDGSLQYKVNVGRNGRVISLEGVDERSRTYLNKTNFLKPGAAVSASSQQDQKVWLILNSTGDVQTLSDGE